MSRDIEVHYLLRLNAITHKTQDVIIIVKKTPVKLLIMTPVQYVNMYQ